MFDQAQLPCADGTIEDLFVVLRLSPMPASTRVSTIFSVRSLCEVLGRREDIRVPELAEVVEHATQDLRRLLGERHSQILSDAKRAIRFWSDDPLRNLAQTLGGKVPTLEEAILAARIAFPKERASRAETAIMKFATWQDDSAPGEITASLVTIMPMLRGARPEDFRVATLKSLNNNISALRAAVELVDPLYVRGREADVKSLPQVWQDLLAVLAKEAPEHTRAIMAIFRRLAVWCARANVAPEVVPPHVFEKFVAYEKKTKSSGHREKLSAASKIWNRVLGPHGTYLPTFPAITKQNRLPDVRWDTVPEPVRLPLDELLVRGDEKDFDDQWSSSLGTPSDLDAELGLGGIFEDPGAESAIPGDPGTRRNWQDAVKRVWHAAVNDPSVKQPPAAFEDLFEVKYAYAFVKAARLARRDRIEASGGVWEGNEKGNYETKLLQTFVSIGKTAGIDEARIAALDELIKRIDPAIVGVKVGPDGEKKYIYEERQIGPKHRKMLLQFKDNSAMRRWFEVGDRLWKLANIRVKAGKTPTIGEVALARSAIILRIVQRVAPLRRENLGRLRISGENPHIVLPVGGGEGELTIAAGEMKNIRRIHVRIDPETAAMIRVFEEKFRPVSMKNANADEANPHLFPGAATERDELGASAAFAAGMGYHTLDKLSATFSKHMWRHARLKIDLHVVRHLAAKVILDMDPSAMGLVQEILGHKRIETTRSYYAEVSAIIAQRRYLELLDKATRKALSQHRYRFDKLF